LTFLANPQEFDFLIAQEPNTGDGGAAPDG
jgi:hypothetical protein